MEKTENPPARWVIFAWSGIMLVCIIGGMLTYLTGSPIGASVFIILLGIGVSLFGMSKELLLRPRSLTFVEEGVVLELPLGRRRTIRWGNITQIYAVKGNLNSLLGRIQRTGGIDEINKAPWELTYELAFRVKDEYEGRFGDRVHKVWKHRLK
jgi:hypothetical protein